MSEYQALAVALHRTLCDKGGDTQAMDHPGHYHDATRIIAELRKWDVRVIHVTPVDEFPTLTVAADGRIAA